MNYPLLSEYIEAIKSAEDNFNELSNLRPVLDDDGQPVMSSGNFAVVFKMKDEQTGKMHAVKCFLKEQEGRAEAYRLIAEELEFVNSTYLTTIKYLDKELLAEELQQAIDAQTKNSNFIKAALTLKTIDFEKNVIDKLLNCKNGWNFKQHLQKLRRNGLIGHDDYSLAIL